MGRDMRMTEDVQKRREPPESLSPEQFALGYRLNMLMDRLKDYRNFKYPGWMIGRQELDDDLTYVVNGYELIMGNHIVKMDRDNKQRMNVLWQKYRS
jgi:hypothetical protein